MSDSDQVLLEPLVVSLDAPSVAAALPTFRGFLAGHLSLLPLHPGPDGTHLSALMNAGPSGTPISPGTLVTCTSGSTGIPKGALLRAEGVHAAIAASATFLLKHTGYGPGPWLLALPPHHIAGAMVILRSVAAGYSPVVLDRQGDSFTAAAFTEATAAMKDAHPDQPLYTSLVPTQLARLLADSESSAVQDALRSYAAILVGGGPTAHSMVTQARDLGISLFLTYGSSETCGGVLYNGELLPGYRAQINNSSDSVLHGRIELSGPSIAEGYRATASLNAAVETDAFPDAKTFRTNDLGEIRDGLLTVLGRSDGAINSGGLKILPEQVEELCAQFGFVACATGVPHPQWGEAVAVLIESIESAEHSANVSSTVRATLKDGNASPYLIPLYAFTTNSLPRTGPGKPDRVQVKGILTSNIQQLSAC